MIRIQVLLKVGALEGWENAERIAGELADIYGDRFVVGKSALWGVSVGVIDDPQPEEELEGFHDLLWEGADGFHRVDPWYCGDLSTRDRTGKIFTNDGPEVVDEPPCDDVPF